VADARPIGERRSELLKTKRPSPHPAVDVNARSSGELEAPIRALIFLAPVLPTLWHPARASSSRKCPPRSTACGQRSRRSSLLPRSKRSLVATSTNSWLTKRARCPPLHLGGFWPRPRPRTPMHERGALFRAPTFLGHPARSAEPSRRAPRSLARSYSPELTAQWTRELADGIKQSIKTQLELPRYKIVVQVVIGEMRGEGVRMGCRCFWDADTDNYADESYRNVRGCRSRAARAASARLPHASACPGAAGAPLTDALFRARRTRSFASRPPSGCTCTKRNSHARHRISRQSLPFSASLSVPGPGRLSCLSYVSALCSPSTRMLFVYN